MVVQVKDWCLIVPDTLPADQGPPWSLRAVIHPGTVAPMSWATANPLTRQSDAASTVIGSHMATGQSDADNPSDMSVPLVQGRADSGTSQAADRCVVVVVVLHLFLRAC